jgi:hypothetical protein
VGIEESSFGYGRKLPPGYEVPVLGMGAEEIAVKLNELMGLLEKNLPPGAGISLFIYDRVTHGGLGYISNSDREGVVRMLGEWILRTIKEIKDAKPR